jgi:hypothetical protein
VIDLDEFTVAASRLEPMPATVTRLAALMASGNSDLAEIRQVVGRDCGTGIAQSTVGS